MIAGLVAGLIAVSMASLGFAGYALALAIKNGKLSTRVATLNTHIDQESLARKGLQRELDNTKTRLETVIHDRDVELHALYGDLEKCGDPAARGAVAVRGIRRMLSGQPPTAPDDTTPNVSKKPPAGR